MEHLSHSFLVSFFVYITLTLSLDLITASPLNQNPSLSTEVRCSEGSRFLSSQPYFNDCADAIHQLPSTYQAGSFHTGGVSDEFRLPVVRTRASCRVYVTLEERPTEEEATWIRIKMAATQLCIACLIPGRAMKTKGGYTFAGERERIRIDVQPSALSHVRSNRTVERLNASAWHGFSGHK